MNFRRFSLSGGDIVDGSVDELLSMLYPGPSELERKCHDSLNGDRFVSLLASVSKVPRPPVSLVVEYEKTPEEVVEGLPKEYFIPNYDPVVAHLEEISSWDKEDIVQRFMLKIEETDTDKDVIIGHLTTMIDTNYDSLMGCMSKVQEINMELCQAEMQVKHARMRIGAASNVIGNGVVKIKSLHKKRLELQSIVAAIKDLKNLKDVYKIMERNVSTGSIGDAAECAYQVAERLKEGGFERFNALRQIHHSFHRCVLTIRQKTDKTLKRLCCRRFSAAEYENVAKSYLILDRLSHNFAVHHHGGSPEEDVTTPFYVDSMGCFDGLAQRINRFQLEDIDACLHQAVVEFIYVGQQKRQRAAVEAAVAGAYNPMKLDEIVDLAEVPMHMLFRKLTPDLLPHCVVRSCERIADIVHTHFLLSSWHHRPFHPQNHNVAHLHNLSSKENGKIDLSESLVAGLDATILEDVLQRLLNSRVPLWEELIRALISMLGMISFTSDVRLEEFVVMLRAMQMMTTLGKQFCGSESQPLTDCVRDKAAEFFRNFHLESFGIVRLMVEAEPWQSVPVQGSLLELMKNTISRDSMVTSSVYSEEDIQNTVKRRISCRRSISKSISFDGSVSMEGEEHLLASFATHGNPFQQLISSEESREGGSDSPASPNSSAALRCAAAGAEVSSMLQEEIDAAKSSTKREKDSSHLEVVTQAVLNGLLKYTVRYLNMIVLVPSASSEILEYLSQLYDYYFSTIFCAFVPADERARFLAVPSKTTSPAPDQSRDFETLQSYLERTLNDMVIVSTKVEEPPKHGNGEISFMDGSDHSPSPFSPNSPHSPRGGANLSVEAVKMSSLIRIADLVASSDASSCFALTERIVAAESVRFAAQILVDSRPIFLRVVSSTEAGKFEQFIEQSTVVARQLASLLYKSACPQLTHQSSMLSAIVETTWESRKMREHPHEWVDKLVGSCRQVWEFIMLSDQLADSSALLREQVWLEVCQSAFDVVLEGYSRVRKCSSEGRAMMTMDVFALHEGLNNVHLCRPPRGKHYMDNYLRAFYLSEDDLMLWVKENWQAYAYRHVHGLLSQSLSSMLANKKFKDAVTVIDGLYEYEKKEAAKVTNMLSQRFKEDKFSNLLTSKFRR